MAPGSWVYKLRAEIRQELCVGPGITDVNLSTPAANRKPIKDLDIARLDLHAHALLHSQEYRVYRPDALRWHANGFRAYYVASCYMCWSCDMMTLSGETFLDVQLGTYQAKAYAPTIPTDICHEVDEVMSSTTHDIE
jgi:hypothetical protein